MQQLIFDSRPELEGTIHIAYCPERVLPGNVMHELVENDRVIGGVNEKSTKEAIKFYKKYVVKVVHLLNELNNHDDIESFKIFRIYRDIRFSNDKTPYKINIGISLMVFKLSVISPAPRTDITSALELIIISLIESLLIISFFDD